MGKERNPRVCRHAITSLSHLEIRTDMLEINNPAFISGGEVEGFSCCWTNRAETAKAKGGLSGFLVLRQNIKIIIIRPHTRTHSCIHTHLLSIIYQITALSLVACLMDKGLPSVLLSYPNLPLRVQIVWLCYFISQVFNPSSFHLPFENAILGDGECS